MKEHDKYWQYKGKLYKVLYESKIKLNGEWEDVVIYECAYHNPEGMIWVRLKDQFFNFFKKL